jgi:tripartite-type tricarboxylate transporter receptor subunit TctC
MKIFSTLALPGVAAASLAAEQSYPTKPVRFIIGPGPGGACESGFDE